MFAIGIDPAIAQDVSGIAAGQLQRQQQQERARSQELEAARPDVRLQSPAPPATTGYPEGESPCFAVNHITLQGDESGVFASSLSSVDDAIGRCLGSGGLNTVISRVQNALIASGYVTTRVLAPPQDLRTGTLMLTVVPGRIRAIRYRRRYRRHAAQRR